MVEMQPFVMASNTNLINTLRRYGARSSKNRNNMNCWLDAAIEDMAANKGGQVVSASTNGASFTLAPETTVVEWAQALDQALLMIEVGVKSTSKSFGRIC